MTTMFLTIQSMKFFLRTAYGDSVDVYGGGLSGSPFQGVCQGNGAGPAIWLVVSMCIIQMVHTHGFPTTITSAISSQKFTLAGFLYVANTDLFYMSPEATTSSLKVVDCLQKRLLVWQHGLHASSGTLAPAKCSWSMLDYYFGTADCGNSLWIPQWHCGLLMSLGLPCLLPSTLLLKPQW